MSSPLVIRIAADLKAFKQNMAEMKVQLETNAQSMKRMANSFDGSRIIADANAMVSSINSIGGASKLTDVEMRRVNATTTEALAKYKALGREAPPELMKLRDDTMKVEAATKQATTAQASLGSQLKSVAGVLGIAFGAGAVIGGLKSLVTSSFDFAEQITDLSQRMDVSKEAAQRWKFAAEQTGSSLESVSKSVLKLSDGLANSDKSLEASLAKAGLSMQALQGMKPEQAFNEIALAIAKVPNPMDQARIALDAFGKSGAELLPALREGFAGIANEASVMSDRTIERLDKAKDTWERWWNNIVVFTGERMGETAQNAEALGGTLDTLYKFFTLDWQPERGLAKTISDLAPKTGPLTASLEGLVPTVMSVKDATSLYETTVGTTIEQEKAAAAEAVRLSEAFQKQVDVLTGKALAQEVAKLNREVAAAEKQGGLTAYQYKELGDRLDEMKDKGAELPNRLHAIWLEHERLNPSIKVSTDAYRDLVSIMKLVPSIPMGLAPPPLPLPVTPFTPDDWTKILNYGAIAGLKPPPEIKTFGDKFLSAFGESLKGIGGVIVGAIQGGGDAMRAAFASIGQSLGQSIANGMKSTLGSALGGFLGPIGAIAGGFIGGALDKIFGKNQGREDAKAFAASFGGFDALRQKMLSLGAEGDRLWIALTQNTKGPAQVAATIKQIEEAFRKAEEAAASAGQTMEDAFQGPEGARGFPTRAQLQKSAQEAKAAYDYMLASGLYTEDVLEQAWKQYEDAAIAAGDKTAKRMKDLSAEIVSLQQAVEAETPEYDAQGVRIYGVEEQRNIERLAALEAEKSAITLQQIEEQKHATEVAAAVADAQATKEFEAAKLRAINLDDYLLKLFSKGYDIPIRFQLPNGTVQGPPSTGVLPPGSGGGSNGLPGLVSRPTGPATASQPAVSQVIQVSIGDEVITRKVAKGLPKYLKLIGAQ